MALSYTKHLKNFLFSETEECKSSTSEIKGNQVKALGIAEEEEEQVNQDSDVEMLVGSPTLFVKY